MSASAMLRCLEELDVAGVRKLWVAVCPEMPQPKSNASVLMMLHYARTQCQAIALRQRVYSHRWLLDNGYPSGLPDELRPRAERMYPKAVGVVGISVNTSERMRAIGDVIRGAMQDAVLEAYADNRTEPEFVRARMMEARERIKV